MAMLKAHRMHLDASVNSIRSTLAPCARVVQNRRKHAPRPLKAIEVEPMDVPSEGSSGLQGPASTSTENEFGMSDVADIKAALLDSLYGTERGLAARSEIRAERCIQPVPNSQINELISQLEAKNPTPNPTEVMDMLSGEWVLRYTSNPALLAVLALGSLPGVTIDELTQRIDSLSMTMENKVALRGPLSRTSLVTTASMEVRSPKRLQLKLEQGKVMNPELTSDLELPSTVSLLGQAVDLTQLKQALAPVNEQLRGVLSQFNNLISQAPEVALPLRSDSTQTWTLNTYVDADTRICRGDGGSVYIYTRAA